MKCQKCKAYAEYLTIVRTVSSKRNNRHIGKSVCDKCSEEIGANKDERN